MYNESLYYSPKNQKKISFPKSWLLWLVVSLTLYTLVYLQHYLSSCNFVVQEEGGSSIKNKLKKKGWMIDFFFL